MKHLKLFKTQSEFDVATLDLPNVSYIVENGGVNFHPYVIDYKSQYLTFETIEDSTFKLTQNACEYSLDEGNTWVSLAAETDTPTVPAGNKIMFKAANPTISISNGIGTFSSTGKFNVEGNIMSMLYGDDFVDEIDLTGKDYVFYKLFEVCTNIVDASKLILQATTLVDSCYREMFDGCTSLTAGPELPATSLANNCYRSIFYNCSSLTKVPSILPATTLYSYCYNGMFYGCTALTSTPTLPATTLAEACYRYMFSGSGLTVAPELPATSLANNCYEYMFYNCKSLIIGPSILPPTSLVEHCYSCMFSGCKSLTAAPELPATTLADKCYYSMFSNCTDLTTVHELPATTLADKCYLYMFSGCKSLTAAPELPATTLTDSCYYAMFYNCTGLTTAPELPATTLADNCYTQMFQDCILLTTAPELPAKTLAYNCYHFMFEGCKKLNYIKMLATDISARACLSSWVQDVATTGTFVKHPDMKTLPTSTSGIPSGWTVIDYQE